MNSVDQRVSPLPDMATPLQLTLSEPAAMNKQVLQNSFMAIYPMPTSPHGIYEAMMSSIGNVLGFFGAIPCCFCPSPFRVISQGSVGLITKFGKCRAMVDPGLYRINLVTEAIQSVDVRIQISDIPRQYVMTKDNVGINIDSVIYWHIVDPYVSTFLVSDVRLALTERTQTTLRHIFGTRNLQDCIENRETIAHEIERIISGPAQSWGVKVEALLIKDLQLSPELLETLSSAAKQRRIGEAKIIAAEAEVKSATLMRAASDILNSRAAMQMRYLETLTQMAKVAGTKVIFMPMNGDQNTMNTTAIDEINH